MGTPDSGDKMPIAQIFAELELENTVKNANTRGLEATKVYSMEDLRKVHEGMAPK